MIICAKEENKQTNPQKTPGQRLPAAGLAQRGVRPCGCRLDGLSSSGFRVSCSIIDSAAALLFSSAFRRWTMQPAWFRVYRLAIAASRSLEPPQDEKLWGWSGPRISVCVCAATTGGSTWMKSSPSLWRRCRPLFLALSPEWLRLPLFPSLACFCADSSYRWAEVWADILWSNQKPFHSRLNSSDF